MSTRSDLRRFGEHLERFASVARDDHLRALRLQNAAEREDVPHVVLDHQNASTVEQHLAIARDLQHATTIGGKLRFDLMQEERDLVEESLG